MQGHVNVQMFPVSQTCLREITESLEKGFVHVSLQRNPLQISRDHEKAAVKSCAI